MDTLIIWQQQAQYRIWEAAFVQTVDPLAWDEADAYEQTTAVLEWAQAHDFNTYVQLADLIETPAMM